MAAALPSDESKDDDDIDAQFAIYTQRLNKCAFPFPDQDTNNITLDRWKQKDYRQRIHFHMKNTYPLVHGGVICLAHNFMALKRKYGSSIERKLYDKMTLVQFFDRLATKRAVVFYKSNDDYILRSGDRGLGGWDLVGTDKEGTKVGGPTLDQYMSYDELLISAMCGISSVTHFINNGTRRNMGRTSDFGNEYPKEGVYMGLVGARFERSEAMEHGLMAVLKRQNTQLKGYGAFDDRKSIDADTSTLDEELNGKLLMKNAATAYKCFGKTDRSVYRAFESWYDVTHLPTYEEVEAMQGTDRYLKNSGWGGPVEYLDLKMFRARIRVSMELFLFDADKRAKEYKEMYKDDLSKLKDTKTGAYCHVVGLGTGVWSFDRVEQNRAIVMVTKEIMGSTNLSHIDCVYFGWFTNDAMWDSHDEKNRQLSFAQDGKEFYIEDKSGHRIDIMFGKREPAGSRDGYKHCLLTAMYAWDSNSFPGNEYYLGMLSASGDPAAAACSTIPFVQNSEINKEYVNGANSGVFFYDPDTKEYEFCTLGEMDFEKDTKKWLTKSLKSVPYKRDRFAKDYVRDVKQGGHSLVDDSKVSGDIDDAFLSVKADGLNCGSSTTAVVIVYSTGKREQVNVYAETTLLQLYAHIKQKEKGKFKLIHGTSNKSLKNPTATMKSLKLLQAMVRVKKA